MQMQNKAGYNTWSEAGGLAENDGEHWWWWWGGVRFNRKRVTADGASASVLCLCSSFAIPRSRLPRTQTDLTPPFPATQNLYLGYSPRASESVLCLLSSISIPRSMH